VCVMPQTGMRTVLRPVAHVRPHRPPPRHVRLYVFVRPSFFIVAACVAAGVLPPTPAITTPARSSIVVTYARHSYEEIDMQNEPAMRADAKRGARPRETPAA